MTIILKSFALSVVILSVVVSVSVFFLSFLAGVFCLFFLAGVTLILKRRGGGESLREQGTGNREQGKCRVPQVFPEHVPEPLRENPSLIYLDFMSSKIIYFE